MRDTDNLGGGADGTGDERNEVFELDMEKSWADLRRLPWASESSLHARVARNGGIIHDTYPVRKSGGTSHP